MAKEEAVFVCLQSWFPGFVPPKVQLNDLFRKSEGITLLLCVYITSFTNVIVIMSSRNNIIFYFS